MKNTLHSSSRRRFLSTLAAGAAALAVRPAWAARQPVVVLTSYPDEVVSRFEAAFEKAHPEYRLQVIWRMPHDSLPYLRQPKQGGVDVYWSASPRNFASLAQEGAWRPLNIDRSGLPDHIGHTRLADSAGLYQATEMAGYGFAVNTLALQRLGAPLPEDWTALTDPRLAGQIALPVPSRVGFAPVMVEIVLQAYGWEKGWALWSEISGNATLLDRGSTFVTDEISSGRRAVGLTIDFFTASAIANGAPIRFIYPRHSGINPAQAAITASAANPEGAKAFVEFLLSNDGQKIITHSDIRKLPVRPAFYNTLPAAYFNPFTAASQGVFDYDEQAALPRLAVITAVFEQMLIARHDELTVLWKRLHQAEAQGKNMAEARRLLCTPPITEAEAGNSTLQQPFKERVEGSLPGTATALEAVWLKASEARQRQAASLLDQAGV